MRLRKSATRGRAPWAPKKLLPGASLCQIFHFFQKCRVTRRDRHLPKKHYPAQLPQVTRASSPHCHDSADYPGNPISLPKTEVRLLTPHGPGKSRISLHPGEEISDPRQENCFSTLSACYLCLWGGAMAHTIIFSIILTTPNKKVGANHALDFQQPYTGVYLNTLPSSASTIVPGPR